MPTPNSNRPSDPPADLPDKCQPKPNNKRRGKLPPARVRALAINNLLAQLYPAPHTALRHDNPLQLLVATILSAQCTDERVNQVTPALFARYRTAEDFAHADPAELEALIRPTGYYRNKARLIRACCQQLVERFGGQVPRTLEELTSLPGIGRKTANVVLGDAYGIPGITVDTHVRRLSRRLGLTRHHDPVKIELTLMKLIPPAEWSAFSHRLILHGRAVCHARKPKCDSCILAALCPRIGVPPTSSPRPGAPRPRVFPRGGSPKAASAESGSLPAVSRKHGSGEGGSHQDDSQEDPRGSSSRRGTSVYGSRRVSPAKTSPQQLPSNRKNPNR